MDNSRRNVAVLAICQSLLLINNTVLVTVNALVGYALLVYPALNALTGHRYPGTATFGLPCPTTLFTIGMLAWLEPPYSRSVLVVPMLWCLVGVQAAFLLDMPADLALAPAALIALVLTAASRADPRTSLP